MISYKAKLERGYSFAIGAIHLAGGWSVTLKISQVTAAAAAASPKMYNSGMCCPHLNNLEPLGEHGSLTSTNT